MAPPLTPAFDAAYRDISSWPGYAPTPLVALPGLAGVAGVGMVWYKGESGRFGLGSFKALSGTVPFDDLPIGSKVRVMPNHACMTAAAYDRYHVVDGGDEVVAVWPRTNRW